MEEGDDLADAYEKADPIEHSEDDDGYDHVSVDHEDGIATITMERTGHNNLINDYMAEDLRKASKRCLEDDDVCCIVLRGTEDVFSTGLDLDGINGSGSDGMRYRVLSNRVHTAIGNFTSALKPVLAGVNGPAIDGGFGLALACDLLLVDENATFQFSYPEVGLSGDCGLTYFLPRSVGRHKAREIAMLHEPIDADEALELGLATEVVASDSFDERLGELAERLASEPTKALGETKSLFNNNYERLLPDHFEKEEKAAQHVIDTDDFERGIEASRSGEEPE